MLYKWKVRFLEMLHGNLFWRSWQTRRGNVELRVNENCYADSTVDQPIKAAEIGSSHLEEHNKLDFLIIGAQKCGTTSLFTYLVKCLNIITYGDKEIHFFNRNFSQSIDWYKKQLTRGTAAGKLVSGEATPYYIFHPLVPDRVYKLFPNVKLIVLLRNPVDRAWSHYHHEVRRGFEQLSFEEAIAIEVDRLHGEIDKMLADETYHSFNHQHYSYLSRGIYVDQLKIWMGIFPRKQFLILKSEDFYANPATSIAQVLGFLGLPAVEIEDYERHNSGSYDEMPDALSQKLADYFRPHNQRLSEYLNRDFTWR